MKFSLIVPHFKAGKATAFCVSQLIKNKGRHDVDIIVVDNNAGDGSARYLEPFREEITIIDYPSDRQQSHGIAVDYILPLIKTEYWIMCESDSYPTVNTWLDYYEFLIDQEYDCAGSFLELSGGSYIHPCGCLYRKSVWEECKKYVDQLPYAYFPNAAHKEGFDCHLMVENKLVEEYIKNPAKFILPSASYANMTPLQITERLEYYLPIGKGVFHNGMGALEESIHTYGHRNINTGILDMEFSKAGEFVRRIGYEPGQFFCYWMLASGKKVYAIPTYTRWMKGREHQNQEFTKMENGFTHIWGVSSYHKAKMPGMEDVIWFKANQVEALYQSLPENEKIPAIADEEVHTVSHKAATL